MKHFFFAALLGILTFASSAQTQPTTPEMFKTEEAYFGCLNAASVRYDDGRRDAQIIAQIVQEACESDFIAVQRTHTGKVGGLKDLQMDLALKRVLKLRAAKTPD